jgi:hypothetical protein
VLFENSKDRPQRLRCERGMAPQVLANEDFRCKLLQTRILPEISPYRYENEEF